MAITNVVGKGGRISESRFRATFEGGPQLATALGRLEEAMRVQAAKAAVGAMGAVLVPAWKARVPIEDRNYQNSIGLRVRGTRTGASGSVTTRKLPDPVTHEGETADEAQPIAYAAVFEFGGVVGSGNSVYIHAQPSARPAFDATREQMVSAAESVLRAAVDGLVHEP